ncbi:Hypothetical predicted protein [Octopus vulgaris]|uniref:Uncharacterized protein n=1 Tax=Octopus vulgaris TaxID=6645 RepID=A0AA36BVT4_OCTVU|nr:Hypothetical predicted protein [Octopus vulgaris]
MKRQPADITERKIQVNDRAAFGEKFHLDNFLRIGCGIAASCSIRISITVIISSSSSSLDSSSSVGGCG